MKKVLSLFTVLWLAIRRPVSEDQKLLKTEIKLCEKSVVDSSIKANESGLNDHSDIEEIKTSVSAQFKQSCGIVTEPIEKGVTEQDAIIDEIGEEQQLTHDEMIKQEQVALAAEVAREVGEQEIAKAAEEQEKAEVEQDLNKTKSFLNSIALTAKAGVVISIKAIVFIGLLILGLEVAFTTPVFDAFGFIRVFSFIASIALAKMLSVSAFLAAKGSLDDDRSSARAWKFVGVAILTFIIGMRIYTGEPIVPGFLLIIFYLTSYHLSKAHLKSRAISAIRADKKRLTKRLLKLITILKTRDFRIIEIEAKGAANVLVRVNARIVNLKTRYVKAFTRRGVLIQTLEGYSNQFKLLEEAALAKVTSSFKDGKKIASKPMDSDTGKSSSNSWWRNAAMTLAVLGLLSLMPACTTISGPENVTGLIELDITDSVQPENITSPQRLFEYLRDEQLNLDENEYFSGGIEIRLSHIDQSSMPRMYTVKLERGSHSLLAVRKKRKAQIETFLEELKQAIFTLYDAPHNRLATYIHRNLQHQLTSLSKVSGTRFFIGITDWVEEGSTIDFTDYRIDPKSLQTDFDKIKSRLEAVNGKFPDLSGISTSMVYATTGTGEDLLFYSRGFWRDLFKLYESDVQLMSNL